MYRAQTLSVSFLFSPSTLQLFLFNSATLQLSGFTSPILPPPSPLPIITLSILHRTLSSSSVASDGSAIPLNNRPDVGRSHWPRLHGYAPTCLPESSLTVNSVPAPSVIPVSHTATQRLDPFASLPLTRIDDAPPSTSDC